MLSIAALLDGIDGSDTGVARLFERVRDIPFRFAAHTDAVARQVKALYAGTDKQAFRA